ncbi:hypothetical protein IW15_14195 [Chryseobacterium soli]|uniref:Uncharacterized protein n=1 Tax=Chryseobacterium soli TaxID=445961 RepID=A0A086A569_9FLAO|nr:hypothetical protein [Chryseobacterium soli]KFF11833.1 hypothetical protein IW15_14195 [Chryseobacterium soli]
MKNNYNKGPFRAYEYGKIPPYLKKYGNKKWRRTATSEIKDHLTESAKFRKKRRKRIWIKITREINGVKRSDYRKYATEKSCKDSINRAHIISYYTMNNKQKNNKQK